MKRLTSKPRCMYNSTCMIFHKDYFCIVHWPRAKALGQCKIDALAFPYRTSERLSLPYRTSERLSRDFLHSHFVENNQLILHAYFHFLG